LYCDGKSLRYTLIFHTCPLFLCVHINTRAKYTMDPKPKTINVKKRKAVFISAAQADLVDGATIEADDDGDILMVHTPQSDASVSTSNHDLDEVKIDDNNTVVLTAKRQRTKFPVNKEVKLSSASSSNILPDEVPALQAAVSVIAKHVDFTKAVMESEDIVSNIVSFLTLDQRKHLAPLSHAFNNCVLKPSCIKKYSVNYHTADSSIHSDRMATLLSGCTHLRLTDVAHSGYQVWLAECMNLVTTHNVTSIEAGLARNSDALLEAIMKHKQLRSLCLSTYLEKPLTADLLVAFPQLTTLGLCIPSDITIDAAGLAPHMRRLTSLFLNGDAFDAVQLNAFVELIEAPSRLTELVVITHNRVLPSMTQRLLDTINRHSGTLEILAVEFFHNPDNSLWDQGILDFIGTSAALKTLCVRIGVAWSGVFLAAASALRKNTSGLRVLNLQTAMGYTYYKSSIQPNSVDGCSSSMFFEHCHIWPKTVPVCVEQPADSIIEFVDACRSVASLVRVAVDNNVMSFRDAPNTSTLRLPNWSLQGPLHYGFTVANGVTFYADLMWRLLTAWWTGNERIRTLHAPDVSVLNVHHITALIQQLPKLEVLYASLFVSNMAFEAFGAFDPLTEEFFAHPSWYGIGCPNTERFPHDPSSDPDPAYWDAGCLKRNRHHTTSMRLPAITNRLKWMNWMGVVLRGTPVRKLIWKLADLPATVSSCAHLSLLIGALPTLHAVYVTPHIREHSHTATEMLQLARMVRSHPGVEWVYNGSPCARYIKEITEEEQELEYSGMSIDEIYDHTNNCSSSSSGDSNDTMTMMLLDESAVDDDDNGEPKQKKTPNAGNPKSIGRGSPSLGHFQITSSEKSFDEYVRIEWFLHNLQINTVTLEFTGDRSRYNNVHEFIEEWIGLLDYHYKQPTVQHLVFTDTSPAGVSLVDSTVEYDKFTDKARRMIENRRVGRLTLDDYEVPPFATNRRAAVPDKVTISGRFSAYVLYMMAKRQSQRRMCVQVDLRGVGQVAAVIQEAQIMSDPIHINVQLSGDKESVKEDIALLKTHTNYRTKVAGVRYKASYSVRKDTILCICIERLHRRD
jgi:hypothetical protein